MGSNQLRLIGKVLVVSLLMGALFFAATLVQARTEAAERRAQVQAAIDAGVLAPPPAWRPAARPLLIDWLTRLAVPLQKLESQVRLAGLGASVSGPKRAASASDAEVLAEVRALLPSAPQAPWILGTKDESQGWHEWAAVVGQLRGLGPAVERELPRLLQEGEGAAALELVADLLVLLQGLGGYEYSQNETIAITEESVLTSALHLLEPAARGDLECDAWLAQVRGRLEPLIDKGLAWDPYQRRLVRTYDARLDRERTSVLGVNHSGASTEGIGLGAQILVRCSDAGAVEVVPFLAGFGFLGLDGVRELVATYAGCLSTQRRYAFLLAVLQACGRACQDGEWPGANSGPEVLDPLTGKPFRWTLLGDGVRLTGIPWDGFHLSRAEQRKGLVWGADD